MLLGGLSSHRQLGRRGGRACNRVGRIPACTPSPTICEGIDDRTQSDREHGTLFQRFDREPAVTQRESGSACRDLTVRVRIGAPHFSKRNSRPMIQPFCSWKMIARSGRFFSFDKHESLGTPVPSPRRKRAMI